MKIILSRKGFDSGYGGCASPIFPDGRLLSLPIPARDAPTRYADLLYDEHSVGNLVSDLSRRKIVPDANTHLDPDLHAAVMERRDGWLPAFGQTGAAQSHLASHAIGPGDLFLFFGWFRNVDKGSSGWRYQPNALDLHVLFGWMQVGEVLDVGPNAAAFLQSHPWLDRHPHMHGERSANNTIYIASSELRINGLSGKYSGGGIFRSIRPNLVLTASNQKRRSLWNLPACFDPEGRQPLSYHRCPSRWTKNADGTLHLQSVGKGQEFVLDTTEYPDVQKWVVSLITGENNE